MKDTKPTVYHVGFDDTDSSDGMCTTFLCYSIVRELISDPRKRTKFLDYPNLIRLNPNIPWKTRGNAALAIRIRSTIPRTDLFGMCKKYVSKFATSPRANAGLLLLESEEIPKQIKDFSKRALFTVLGLREAREIIKSNNLDWFSLRSKQGSIGALAAIGNTLEKDHTYELIAYRKEISQPRVLDRSKVILMSESTFPDTFSSYDAAFERVMIAPHGPDPVLCGIRGESASAVKDAFKMLHPVDNLLGWMIFRSNQGTGEHLQETICLDNPKAYTAGKVVGTVSTLPQSHVGGHVFFTIVNEQGSIMCACYEPTAMLRRSAMSLIIGDIVEVGGGVRKSTTLHPKVLNLEYIRPIKLAKKFAYYNPRCADCEISMSSMGRGQGFRCPKCRRKLYASKEVIEETRKLTVNKTYTPPVRAHRHLTKPEQRCSLMGRKTVPLKLLDVWHS